MAGQKKLWSRGSLTIEVEFISNFLMNNAWSRGSYSTSLVNFTKVERLVTKGGEGETWRVVQGGELSGWRRWRKRLSRNSTNSSIH